jgi:tRNA uracil 4-sulfurtransferase
MKKVIVIRYGEVALKKGNRDFFVKALMKNVLSRLGNEFSVLKRYGRIVVSGDVENNESRITEVLSKTFGIENFSFGVATESEVSSIESATLSIVDDPSLEWETFRITVVRQDKTFPMKSMEIARHLGGTVLDHVSGNKDVKMKGADLEIFVEVTDRGTYVSASKIPGPGGLPVGVTGQVLCLLSGGIDSPVAAWRMMKRGCIVNFIHFHSSPYTDKASLEKVRELAEILSKWQHGGQLIEIPFIDIQKKLSLETDERFRIILYRRIMIRIAEYVARTGESQALVTGESLAQVASQTLENLSVIDEVSSIPILRPLIGMDKLEIKDQASRIGTYETSIIPHQDCCSLFTPRHPATRAKIDDIRKEEAKIDIDSMIKGSGLYF